MREVGLGAGVKQQVASIDYHLHKMELEATHSMSVESTTKQSSTAYFWGEMWAIRRIEIKQLSHHVPLQIVVPPQLGAPTI